MNTGTRLKSLDLLRGVALLFILLFHSSIYGFANIHKIDFDNPPIIVVLMSFMALWGGIFIMYSAVVNTMMLVRRTEQRPARSHFRYLIIAAVLYLGLHVVLNIFLGRWANDFVNNQPNMTFVAASLRAGDVVFPTIQKLYEGSALSSIACNLLVLTGMIFFLFRNDGIKKQKRNYWILGSLGVGIMLLSFVRVPLFHLVMEAIETSNVALSLLYSLLLENPYPLLPYLGYGLLGTLLAMMYAQGRTKVFKRTGILMAIGFLLYGIVGMMQFEKSISTPDYFWYFKTHFELGAFIGLLLFVLLVIEPRMSSTKRTSFLAWFSRVSLTVYLLETFVSELLRLAYLRVNPGWDQSINGSLIFGGMNILVWILILWLWSKVNFKYSLEYWWVTFFRRIGKQSTKLVSVGDTKSD